MEHEWRVLDLCDFLWFVEDRANQEADVKALILVTLVFPSWSFVPDQMYPLVEDPLFRMPPSMVLFIWAAAAILVAPPIIFIQNAARGNISSLSDLKMAWHATKRRISDIKETSDSTSYQSWILTEAIEKKGEMSAVDRILLGDYQMPKTRTSSSSFSRNWAWTVSG